MYILVSATFKKTKIKIEFFIIPFRNIMRKMKRKVICIIKANEYVNIIDNNQKSLMSYGWLTESAILPRKSKEIKTKQSGMVGMEAAMLQLKEKADSSKNKNELNKKQKTKEKQRKNPGIAQRMLRDEEQANKFKEGNEKNTYKYLQKKAEIYNQMNSKKLNVEKILVDFEARETVKSKQQQEEFEKDREDFYNGRLSEINQQQKSLHEQIETQNSGLSQFRERLAWEKEVLNELKRGGEELQQKPKVIQSFDHKLTKDEKQALGSVIEEEQEERIRIEEVKKRREALEQERIRKLKKLNIIREDDEKVVPLNERK